MARLTKATDSSLGAEVDLGYLAGNRISSAASAAEAHVRLIAWLFRSDKSRAEKTLAASQILRDQYRA